MTQQLTADQVWDEINRQLFVVLGMVTARSQSRTVGVVYVVNNRKLYIGTGKDTWKARHITANPAVSLTIPIARRIPIAPWVKIPQATITFSGTARLIACADAQQELNQAVFRHYADDPEFMRDNLLIEVTPEGEFLTYGIGIPLMQMRHPHLARGRAPVD